MMEPKKTNWSHKQLHAMGNRTRSAFDARPISGSSLCECTVQRKAQRPGSVPCNRDMIIASADQARSNLAKPRAGSTFIVPCSRLWLSETEKERKGVVKTNLEPRRRDSVETFGARSANQS